MASSSSKKTSLLMVAVVSVVAVLGLSYAIYSSLSITKVSMVSPVLSVKAKDVVRSNAAFFESFNDPKLLRHGSKSCKGPGDCFYRTDGEVSDSANISWRTLAFATLWKVTGDSRFAKNIDKDAEQLDVEPANSSVAQVIATAGRLSGNEKLLKRSFANAVALLVQSGNYTDAFLIESLHPMLLASVSRLFSEISLAMQTAELQPFFKKNGWVAQDGKNAYNEMFAGAAVRYARLSDEAVGLEKDSDGNKFPVDGCWANWAYAGIYHAWKDPNLVNKLRVKFLDLRPWEVARTNLKVSAIQPILACISALQDMSGAGPDFDQGALQMIEKFLLPAWDSSERPICSGDNAFFSDLNGVNPCENREKKVSDNAWALNVIYHASESKFSLGGG